MNKKVMEVVVCDYNEEGEFFTVKMNNGKHTTISKAEMSFYPLKLEKQIEALINTKIRVAVIEDDADNNNIRLSRKLLTKYRIDELTDSDPIGKELTVTVISASESALYVDLGDGISGIIYKNDIISAPFSYPTDIFPVGSVIKAKIKNYKKEKGFFTLSHRDLFSKDKSKYSKGMHIQGTIRSPILKRGEISGYFVEITPAISGILDVSDNIRMDNGEKIPMVINDITYKGMKLRLEFPN